MLEMVLIPKGTVEMGNAKYTTIGGRGVLDFRGLLPNRSGENGNEYKHTVEITKSFYMGQTTITQEQYLKVVGTSPSYLNGRNKNPVESVNWFDAKAFCDKLNKQAGPTKVTFELPTEAQWEYACRAGTTTEYYFGDDKRELHKFGWFELNAIADTGYLGAQPVGLKLANAFGLFDMHGNVYQWCHDWYDEHYYEHSPREDPTGPDKGIVKKELNTGARVLRGGSFRDPSTKCRSAYRFMSAPIFHYDNVACRTLMHP